MRHVLDLQESRKRRQGVYAASVEPVMCGFLICYGVTGEFPRANSAGPRGPAAPPLHHLGFSMRSSAPMPLFRGVEILCRGREEARV